MTLPKRKKAAFLGRNSTSQQEFSIEIQIAKAKELAAAHGYDLVEYYIDKDRSGSKNPHLRKEFSRMLVEAPTAEWEVLLCVDQSRFTRLDPYEAGLAVQILRRARKVLHTLDGVTDWETMASRIAFFVRSEEAHSAARLTAFKTIVGKLAAFKGGRPFGTRCPYGLARRVTDEHGHTINLKRGQNFVRPKGWKHEFVPGDPEEVKVIIRIFKTFAAQDVGLRWIARQLNKEMIPTACGAKWNASMLRRILRNERYVGDSRYGKFSSGHFARILNGEVVQSTFHDTGHRQEGLLRTNTHKGIISRDLWAQVQKKLATLFKFPGRRSPRGEGGSPLTGLIYCGHCNKTMFGLTNKSIKGSGKRTYVCRTANQLGPECGCAIWSIREEVILPLVIQRLIETVDDMQVLKPHSVQPPDTKKQRMKNLPALEASLADYDQRLKAAELLQNDDRLSKQLAGTIADYRRKRNRLEAQVKSIKQSLPELQNEISELRDWLRSAKDQLVLLQQSPERGATIEGGLPFTPAKFREILRGLDCKITCWWRQIPFFKRRRWEIEKVRVQLGKKDASVGTKSIPNEAVA